MIARHLKKITVNKLLIFRTKNSQRVLYRGVSRKYSTLNAEPVVRSPYPSIEYPRFTIDQYVWEKCSNWMDKVAVVDGVTGESLTYSQLRDYSRAFAVRLQTVFNISANDVVAICLPNVVEYPIVTLGALEAEAVVTTVNPIYTATEIARQLASSEAKVLVGLVKSSSILEEAVRLSKQNISIVYIKKSGELLPRDGVDFYELINVKGLDLNQLRSSSDKKVNGTSFLPYSSGTTGLSKGVMLSHMNVVSNSIMTNYPELAHCHPAVGNYQDVLPCVLPFFHIYGFTVTMISKLAIGCKLVTLSSFHPETYLNALEKHKGNILYLVPPIVVIFNNYDKVKPKHTESIQICMSGAAPLGEPDIEKFLLKAPQAKFLQGYGMTEASPMIFISRINSKNYGSAGVSIPDTEAKVAKLGDPEFKGVGSNESGEILVRGPQVMLGYHNNEAATRETITPDGWLRTGDIGYYDENGEFYITDRLKELIKVKAFQVAPAELEEILRSHPQVADAAVIGIPDERSGELPKAFIVPKDSQLTEHTVKNFVAERVAEYKRLEGGIKILQSIPKSSTGKILRKELKRIYVEGDQS